MKRARAAERDFHAQKKIGFTATSSLKSQGRIPRASGCYSKGAKYAGNAGRQTRKTRR